MAKKTLQSEMNKKRSKLSAFSVEERTKENAGLTNVIDLMADQEEYSKAFEVKGFTKAEVIQAAKFVLKAAPYDIDVRHLDVTDSPIYYKKNNKNKLKSRGRFKRKDLDDAGKALIARARQVKEELDEKERQRIAREADNILHASATIDIGEDIDETAGTDAYRSRDESGYETSKVVDDIMDNTDYSENLDKFFEGTLAVNKQGEMVEDEAHDYLMKTIDSTIDKKIPSLAECKAILDDKVKERMEGELIKLRDKKNVDNETIIRELGPIKEKFVQIANKNLLKYKEMYDAVSRGEMAPEVLKVFLNTAIMGNITKSETHLYNKLVTPKNVEEPTGKENDEYRETLVGLALKTHGNPGRYRIGLQIGAGRTKTPYEWVRSAQYYNVIPRDTKWSSTKDLLEISFKHVKNFVHFQEDPAPGVTDPELRKRIIEKKAKSLETDKRIYITCKPKKEKALIQAWWKTLEAYPEMKNAYFKMGTGIYFDRQEKIVLYLPVNKKMEDVKPFLNSFSEECAKEDILADNANTMITAKKIKPGIGFAVEPKLKILNSQIGNGWMNKTEYEKMYRLTNPGYKGEIRNDCAYSYNMWVNKALILSCSIAKKKLNLKPEDKFNDHKKELVPLMKKYFADFMKLAGADPKTLDMLPADSREEELK